MKNSYLVLTFSMVHYLNNDKQSETDDDKKFIDDYMNRLQTCDEIQRIKKIFIQ